MKRTTFFGGLILAAFLLLVMLGVLLFNKEWPSSVKYTVIDKAELTGLAGPRVVSLPNVLETTDFLPKGSRVNYRLRVDMSEAPLNPVGVFVPKMSLSGALFVNGQFIANCGHGPLEALRCLHKPNFFSTSKDAWRLGENTIEFEIHANARQMNGLSAIQIGELHSLHENNYRLLHWFKIEFLDGLMWISVAFGLLSLAVYFILRKEPAFLWFGFACLMHAIGLLIVTVSNPVFNVEFFTWMGITSRLMAIPFVFLTMLSLFEKLQRWMIFSVLVLMLSVPIVIGLSGVSKPVVQLISLILIIFGIALFLKAIRWVLDSRSPIKIAAVVMSYVILFTGAADWMRFAGKTEFEGSFFFPYSYSGMLLVLGTFLIRNLATSLKQSREDRAQLERRAVERMAYEVTENIPVGTYTLIFTPGEAQGRFLFVSQRFIELTGLNRQDLLNDPHVFAEILHKKALPDWEAFICNRSNGRVFSPNEWPIFPLGLEKRWVRTEAAIRTLPDGSNLYEGVLFDRTEVVKARAESDRIRNELQAQQIEQSLLKERERLLRDMHDGFGSQLASVRMMAEKGRIRPEQFPEFLSEITADLHLVMDTMGQHNITLEEALVDMHHRLERRFVGSGHQLHWKTRLAGLPPLAPHKILQALRLVQEALNNAFKHSQAKQFWFEALFDAENDVMTLSVRDDGRGMSEPISKGRGLSNMQHRAREMGGEFQLIAHRPGVEVLLRVERVSLNVHEDSK
jgi:signal transduction histidine kinase